MGRPRAIGAEDLPDFIEAGNHVQLAGSFSEPRALSDALVKGRGRWVGLPVWTTQPQSDSPLCKNEPDGRLDVRLLLSSPAAAPYVTSGRMRYVPCRYPDIGRHIDDGRLACDVALVHVSPPDARGQCSLGTTVGYLRAALRRAKRTIAQINPRVPRTHGDTLVPLDRFDAVMEVDAPLGEYVPEPAGDAERAIGASVAALVPDGATIEIGYGAIPDAVLAALHGHRDIGIHTGMISDGVVDLVESGVANGACKPVDTGLVVATTAIGTQRLYEWLHGNARVALRETTAVCDPAVIAAMPAYRAINTTIEVDLLGQANSEVAAGRLLGGYGSLVELAQGGHGAPGGLAILALTSMDARGRSKVVARLSSPLGATLGKLDTDLVVTEHGVADLRLLEPRARARALIAIADPRHRPELLEAAREILRPLGGL